MNGAIGHVDLDKVWPYTFPQLLREKKGYATGALCCLINWSLCSSRLGIFGLEFCVASLFRVYCCCGAACVRSALFGKCMNDGCGPNPSAASGIDYHQIGAVTSGCLVPLSDG